MVITLCSLLLNLQICITTSTSAGLEQILPWMFFHKVIGVSTFFLFVEGKAASPAVSKVLESIPVSWYISSALTAWHSFKLTFWFANFSKWSCSALVYIMFFIGASLSMIVILFSQGVKVIYRTRELEEQQAKRFDHCYFQITYAWIEAYCRLSFRSFFLTSMFFLKLWTTFSCFSIPDLLDHCYLGSWLYYPHSTYPLYWGLYCFQ